MSASRWRWSSRESRYLAEDALADIVVDIEPLPAVVDLGKALSARSGAGPRRPPAPTSRPRSARPRANIGGAGASHGSISAASFTTAAPLRRSRPAASSPHWDERADHLTVWDTTQAPVFLRGGLAGLLGLSERQVRGDRALRRRRLRPQDHAVLSGGSAAAMGGDAARAGRSSGSRTAASTSSPPPTSAAISTTPKSRSIRDGRILGVKDVFLHDGGAYDPYGLTVPINSQCTLLGPYVAAELRTAPSPPASPTS